MLYIQDILECCCGLDVHKKTIVACILKGPIGQNPSKEIRTFTTLLPDLRELRQWIEQKNCHFIAMESTGIYWQPVYEILETAYAGDMTLIVANARHIKNVPGKKTDMKDAEWIASFYEPGF